MALFFPQFLAENYILSKNNTEDMSEFKDLYSEIKARKMKALGKENIVKAVEHDGKLLVIRGKYDKPETVLKFAYCAVKDVIRPEDVPKYNGKLKDYDLVVIGCPGTEIPKIGITMFRDYVMEEGGWILATDWALRAIVEPAFPGYVHWNGEKTDDCVVPCHLTQSDHPIVDGIASGLNSGEWDKESKSAKAIKAQMEAEAKGTFKWWLEDKSFPIVIDRPADVVELIHSNEIQKKWRAGTVFCYFDPGNTGGRVFVMISHVHLQKGGAKGQYVSATLMTNIMDVKVGTRKGLIKDKKKGAASTYVDLAEALSEGGNYVVPNLQEWKESDYEVWKESDMGSSSDAPISYDMPPDSQGSGSVNAEFIGTSQIIEAKEKPGPTQKCALGDGTFTDYEGKIYQCKECGAPYHEECLQIQMSEGVCKICGRILLF